jgi:hypothetical protein
VNQIVPLPSLPGLTSIATANCQTAGCTLLLAIRQWRAACQDVGKAGVPGSPRTVMAAVARLAEDSVASGGATGTADGTNSGLDRLAEKALRDILLSAPGGEFAPGPPDGTSALLSQARLFLTRRGTLRDGGRAGTAGPAP